MNFDVILKGGWVVDGSGCLPFRADVALLDDVIAEIGRLDDASAPRILDATDRYIVPGFIDAHVHGDLMLLADPVHLPALRQGVTTYLIGQDGSSFAPASPATLEYMRVYTAGFNGNPPGLAYGWRTIDEYLSEFHRRVAINVAYLIPNGNLRMEAMGLDPSPASDGALEAMRKLVREGMDSGAVGLSSGLDYIPSRYANARELAELCEIVAREGGVYVSHIRGYGAQAPAGMAELCDIARASGAPAHVSHYHGPADVLLPLVDTARALGLDITFDTYPYLAGNSILGMVALPAWVQEGGVAATLERLAEPAIRKRLRQEWFAGPLPNPLERVTVALAGRPEWTWAEGLSIPAAAAERGVDPADFVVEILLGCALEVGVLIHRGPDRTEADIRAILRHPAHMAGSDGIFRGGKPHPRGWGSFARYLGRHTRELGDYDWAQAVAHLSSHAARRFRLTDRGLLRVGFAADVVVLDPATVADPATYDRGNTLAQGVEQVFVNGVQVLANGQPTRATPGRALRRG